MLIVYFIGFLTEILIVTSWFWPYRFWVIGITVSLTSIATGVLVGTNLNLITLLILVVSLFRIINVLRVAEQRMNEHYLRRVVLRCSLYLISGQILIYIFWQLVTKSMLNQIPTSSVFMAIASAQVVVCIGLLTITKRTLAKTKFRPLSRHYSDHELPTVTVAIPARNESDELNHCLDAVTASDYPKLEVIVLDDSSQDRTPDVIKDFARAGVRFIHGEVLRTNWVAKNQAYEQLTRAATGEFILFISVDTLISPTTVRALVTSALDKHKAMLCVMPKQQVVSDQSLVLQPMRYWWELTLPRRIANRPAVTTSCWMIKRQSIDKFGGFEAISRAVLPEAYFARRLITTDEYSFVRSNGNIELMSSKDKHDQFERTIRVRYPEAHRRLELALLITLSEIFLFLSPFAILFYGLVAGSSILTVISLMGVGCLLYIQYLISMASVMNFKIWQVVKLPVMAMTEIALGLYSMYKYEFSTVDWKGRNIALPVMHVIPLPERQ